MAFGQSVGGQQVLGHVGVEAGAEDAEVAFGEEGKRGGCERQQGNRGSDSQRLSPVFEASPKVEGGDHGQQEDARPPRSLRDPAAARSPSKPRRPAPGRPRAPATTSGAHRRARPPPARSPARRRRWPARLHRSRSRGREPRLRAWPSSRPPATCCAPRTSPTPATSSRSASTTSPRAAGLSRAHFSREFRRAFGESPHAYLLTRRLERAAALLRTTDRSVADICLSVGLQSVGSFTTSFTRTYGLSPTAYRAAFPPASSHALVPGCVVRAYGRPQHRTFREDSTPTPHLASPSTVRPSEGEPR